MDELRFKVGDKVKVVACHWGHMLEIGSTVKITEVREWSLDYKVGVWCVREDELEPINDQEEVK